MSDIKKEKKRLEGKALLRLAEYMERSIEIELTDLDDPIYKQKGQDIPGEVYERMHRQIFERLEAEGLTEPAPAKTQEEEFAPVVAATSVTRIMRDGIALLRVPAVFLRQAAMPDDAAFAAAFRRAGAQLEDPRLAEEFEWQPSQLLEDEEKGSITLVLLHHGPGEVPVTAPEVDVRVNWKSVDVDDIEYAQEYAQLLIPVAVSDDIVCVCIAKSDDATLIIDIETT